MGERGKEKMNDRQCNLSTQFSMLCVSIFVLKTVFFRFRSLYK